MKVVAKHSLNAVKIWMPMSSPLQHVTDGCRRLFFFTDKYLDTKQLFALERQATIYIWFFYFIFGEVKREVPYNFSLRWIG